MADPSLRRAPHPPVARWQVGLAGVLALVGFLTVTQIRTEVLIKRTLRLPSSQLEELGFMLREQERHRAGLEAQVADLRNRLAEYEKAAAEGRTAVARLNRELQEMRTLVGLTALEGPGVVVELNDSTRPPTPGEDPNKTILHYTDIAAVVAELWAAGAEAVALNGERVISSTGITCVGTTILCNTKRMAPPYVIKAIGDPEALARYLRRPGGALELLAAFDFPVRLVPSSRVDVPPYRGTFRFEYAGVSEKE
ncbi:MAG: DUF881 domain-containing protein [Armatimonadota bacterium]|nr:DUF881 domain-containing protein [Armatimonadota bacterium]MDR7519938.1 DUF881 domain-containing protein [Armatimonadota bacterium]MDR7550914.1 DUF881 domain-containing protein [Armatimonadota bacterium]